MGTRVLERQEVKQGQGSWKGSASGQLTFGIRNDCTLQCVVDANFDRAIGGLPQQSRGDSVKKKRASGVIIFSLHVDRELNHVSFTSAVLACIIKFNRLFQHFACVILITKFNRLFQQAAYLMTHDFFLCSNNLCF